MSLRLRLKKRLPCEKCLFRKPLQARFYFRRVKNQYKSNEINLLIFKQMPFKSGFNFLKTIIKSIRTIYSSSYHTRTLSIRKGNYYTNLQQQPPEATSIFTINGTRDDKTTETDISSYSHHLGKQPPNLATRSQQPQQHLLASPSLHWTESITSERLNAQINSS